LQRSRRERRMRQAGDGTTFIIGAAVLMAGLVIATMLTINAKLENALAPHAASGGDPSLKVAPVTPAPPLQVIAAPVAPVTATDTGGPLPDQGATLPAPAVAQGAAHRRWPPPPRSRPSGLPSPTSETRPLQEVRSTGGSEAVSTRATITSTGRIATRSNKERKLRQIPSAGKGLLPHPRAWTFARPECARNTRPSLARLGSASAASFSWESGPCLRRGIRSHLQLANGLDGAQVESRAVGSS